MNISRGMFAVVLGFGLLAAAHATNRYVSLSGTNDSANGYTNWAGAATNIQYAISACSSGDVVWVTNGIYDVGGVSNFPSGYALTTRVAITTAYITVRSANNNPSNTIIKGARDANLNGPSAVRCVYMVDNCSLIGFTLSNGATLNTGSTPNDAAGGIFCPSTVSNATISNCVITCNCGQGDGGGAAGGTYYNCVIMNNYAPIGYGGGIQRAKVLNSTLNNNTSYYGGGESHCGMYNCVIVSNVSNNGGVIGGTLTNCLIMGNNGKDGGGVRDAVLYHCTIVNNIGSGNGGAKNCVLYNCKIIGNQTGGSGGGAYNCMLYNCTVVGNWANLSGGGTANSTSINSIVYFNSAGSGSNWTVSAFSNSCTAPTATVWAAGNTTNDPLFVDPGRKYGWTNIPGDYHIRVDSPCVNAGMNLAWMTNAPDPRSKDLDGQRRIQYGTVDMGIYERLNRGIIFNAH